MHDHSQHQNADGRNRNLRRISITLGLVVVYMLAEVIGGLLTNSLALLADAGHMLSDAVSLGLALFALWIARRPRTSEKTFGYHRAEILAALANGVTLVAVAVFIMMEAWDRLQSPEEVAGGPMMGVALGGLLVNLIGVAVLHGGRNESLNVRGAWLHVVADTLGSLQAVIAGALIWAFGWDIADPIASVLIALLVFWSSWSLLKETVNVLMEATPVHIDADAVSDAIGAVEGVVQVHDLHLWTISSGFESLTVHIRAEGRSNSEILREIRGIVRTRFGIEHSTVQIEDVDGCDQDECC